MAHAPRHTDVDWSNLGPGGEAGDGCEPGASRGRTGRRREAPGRASLMAALAGRKAPAKESKGLATGQKSDRRSGRGNRRLKPRLIHPPVECDLGRVIDLSAQGLRVELSQRRRLRVGVSLKITLGRKDIPVRVVWLKRRLFTRTVGLAFESISPELREMLTSIVTEAISTTAWFDGEPRNAA